MSKFLAAVVGVKSDVNIMLDTRIDGEYQELSLQKIELKVMGLHPITEVS